jgi:hypothetical protein
MSPPNQVPPVSDIEVALQESATKEDQDFAEVFRKRHASEPERGCNLPHGVFGFLFRPHNASAPFQPVAVWDGRRSMIPSDLGDEQLSLLAGAADSVDDPEFRARILDVLWQRRRDVGAARGTVEAYLQSGSRLEHPEHWVCWMQRYERAVRLAYQVEAKWDLPKKALAHLEARPALRWLGPALLHLQGAGAGLRVPLKRTAAYHSACQLAQVWRRSWNAPLNGVPQFNVAVVPHRTW